MFKEVGLNSLYCRSCVRLLMQTLINSFHFIITVFGKYSNMCEMKAVLGSLSLNLLVAASFCVYQAHTEKKLGNHSEIKSQGF